MGLFSNIVRSLGDLQAHGAGFALNGVRRKFGTGTLAVDIPGVGPIHIRRGDSDFHVLRSTFGGLGYQVFAPPAAKRVQARYQQILDADEVPVIVDAGANIGVTARWMTYLYPKAAIVAIEPDPDNAALLRRNAEGYPNIHVLEAAIGAQAGFVSLIAADESWAIRTERADSGCPVVTISDAVATIRRGRLLIAKIDIEGFEGDLFSDNLGWLDEAYALLLEPHEWMLPGDRTSHGFQRELGKRDFDLFVSGENLIYVRS